jgi:L-asparaginase
MSHHTPNKMEYKRPTPTITPRLIIHGGAGNILPSTLPPSQYKAYHDSLLTILCTTHAFLTHPSTTALDAATHAVVLLENNPLFNAGHGAVFTRDGINELEASVMVSRGYKKRGVGVMGLQRVRNPIKLAREMLVRGEQDLEGGNGTRRGERGGASGAQGHSQLHQYSAEILAEEWGLEIVDPSYFYTQTRWDEHIRALEKEEEGKASATWDKESYISQGTVGAVAMDAEGVIAVATSTGGMTNKLRGRIGDTPTLGAGFWAEEWDSSTYENELRQPGPALVLSETLKGMLADCSPSLSLYTPHESVFQKCDTITRATGLSGTGNGDSFLRLCAARTASALSRFSSSSPSLQTALTAIVGPGGELQHSAGDRWGKTGEGEGGMIGIEAKLVRGEEGERVESEVVQEFNCGGMWRAMVGGNGRAVMWVWRVGGEVPVGYEGEGVEYDVREWRGEK